MVGWIRALGGCVRVRETVWNTLKGGQNGTKGRENKNFEKEGKLGQGIDALKRGRAGTPLRTMKTYLRPSKIRNRLLELLHFLCCTWKLTIFTCPHSFKLTKMLKSKKLFLLNVFHLKHIKVLKLDKNKQFKTKNKI